MISELVLSLAFLGGVRDHLDDEGFREAAEKMVDMEIHTKDDVELLFNPQKLEEIHEILDVNGDGLIDVYELAVLEMDGAEVASFELSDYEALSLADGAVREDGELGTDHVDKAHFRNWFVDTAWKSLLLGADTDGDNELSDEEWAVFSRTEVEQLKDLHAPVDAEAVGSAVEKLEKRQDLTPPDNAVEALVEAGSVYTQVMRAEEGSRRRIVFTIVAFGITVIIAG